MFYYFIIKVKNPPNVRVPGISVPAYSQLGKQLLRREEQELKEKERVKQLTLEISERQEEEELHEARALDGLAAKDFRLLVNDVGFR